MSVASAGRGGDKSSALGQIFSIQTQAPSPPCLCPGSHKDPIKASTGQDLRVRCSAVRPPVLPHLTPGPPWRHQPSPITAAPASLWDWPFPSFLCTWEGQWLLAAVALGAMSGPCCPLNLTLPLCPVSLGPLGVSTRWWQAQAAPTACWPQGVSGGTSSSYRGRGPLISSGLPGPVDGLVEHISLPSLVYPPEKGPGHVRGGKDVPRRNILRGRGSVGRREGRGAVDASQWGAAWEQGDRAVWARGALRPGPPGIHSTPGVYPNSSPPAPPRPGSVPWSLGPREGGTCSRSHRGERVPCTSAPSLPTLRAWHFLSEHAPPRPPPPQLSCLTWDVKCLCLHCSLVGLPVCAPPPPQFTGSCGALGWGLSYLFCVQGTQHLAPA